MEVWRPTCSTPGPAGPRHDGDEGAVTDRRVPAQGDTALGVHGHLRAPGDRAVYRARDAQPLEALVQPIARSAEDTPREPHPSGSSPWLTPSGLSAPTGVTPAATAEEQQDQEDDQQGFHAFTSFMKNETAATHPSVVRSRPSAQAPDVSADRVEHHDLDAAVLLATCLGRIRRERRGRSESLGLDSRRRDPASDQHARDRVRSLPRELVIVLRRPRGVGVTFDQHRAPGVGD